LDAGVREKGSQDPIGSSGTGGNPAEERQLDHKAVTVKELRELYLKDFEAGLLLGKGGRPKKATTIVTDAGRINRHIVPLIGTRRVLFKADINKVLKDVMAGKTRVSVETKKLCGKANVRGGAGTATRTVGLLGGILTCAVEPALSRAIQPTASASRRTMYALVGSPKRSIGRSAKCCGQPARRRNTPRPWISFARSR
jgi:hypothetical protein